MLGVPYMEISSPDSSAPPVQDGDILRGNDPPSLSKVFETASNALDGLKDLVDRLNEVEGAGTPIKIDEFINNIGSLAGNLDERIKENADHIDSIFEDVAGILDENRDKIPPILDNVEGLTRSEERRVGKAGNTG